MKKIIIVLFCVSFLSCQSKREQLKPSIVSPHKTFDQLNDSTFFASIIGMFYSDEKFYLSELSRSELFILDKDYLLSDIIGGRGRGPGEFSFIGHIEVSHDSIFVVNGNGVSLFVNKHFIRNIPQHSFLEKNIKRVGGFDLRFAYRNGYIYYYPLSENPEILKHNIYSDDINIFALSNINDIHKKNRGHVVCDGVFIYAVMQNSPFIEKYSMAGERIEIYDYSRKIDFLYTLKYIDEQERQPGTISTLVRDVSYYNGHLYLLIYLRDHSEKFISNTILAINTSDKSDMKLYHLDNGGYFTLTACKDGLFLFDIKNAELKLYNLY